VALSHHITTGFKHSNLTTTELLNQKLFYNLIEQYGQKAVSDRVVVISKMNGQIKNKTGLLVASLKGNYIPTCKEFREKEKSEAHSKWIDQENEKRRKEIEEWEGETKLTPEQIKEMIDQVGKEN
jgi:hypothetical protein